MARNIYFSESLRSEQNLYEDIVIESLKIYGQDVFYLPRDIVNEDTILGDDIPSRFNSSHIIEMYIENTEGFDGEGDLFTKFGVEIRDEATFVVSRRRWKELKKIHKDINFKKVKKSLKIRNFIDKNRKHNPLKKVTDAVLIRTDILSKKAMVAKMSKEIDKKLILKYGRNFKAR